MNSDQEIENLAREYGLDISDYDDEPVGQYYANDVRYPRYQDDIEDFSGISKSRSCMRVRCS